MASERGEWWQGQYQIERECTCKGHARSAECNQGWHVVDSWDSLEWARHDVAECTKLYGHAYRITRRSTGEVLT